MCDGEEERRRMQEKDYRTRLALRHGEGGNATPVL